MQFPETNILFQRSGYMIFFNNKVILKLIWLLPSILIPFIAVLSIYIDKSWTEEELLVDKQVVTKQIADEKQEIVEKQVITKTKFRSKYKTLSVDSVKSMLKRYNFYCAVYYWGIMNVKYSNPVGSGFQNKFEELRINDASVISDHACGLMWQQFGSSFVNYESARAYVAQLNRDQFAGYSDWHLPTLEEAMSLMEAKENRDFLYIDSKFYSMQNMIWTSDLYSSTGVWVVYFDSGHCKYSEFDDQNYVRAVR